MTRNHYICISWDVLIGVGVDEVGVHFPFFVFVCHVCILLVFFALFDFFRPLFLVSLLFLVFAFSALLVSLFV